MEQDYTFKLMFIKPNNPFNEQNTYYFEEFFHKVLKQQYDYPIDSENIDYNILTDYLSNKKDIIEVRNVNFNKLLDEIYFTINPRNEPGRCFDTKTCYESDDELIMFMYDYSIKDTNQFNHIASLFSSNFESIFGPVFITKMLKDSKGKAYKHVDFSYDEFIKLWVSLKQVKYLDFTNEWSIKTIFNNNQHLNDYKFININKFIVFFKLKKDVNDIEKFLTDNIKNKNYDLLNEYFTNIKICRLKLGEYSTETYNSDLVTVKEHIITNAINSFRDSNDVVMECIFMDIDKSIDLIFN